MKKTIITISIIISLAILSYLPVNTAYKTNTLEDIKTSNDVIFRDDFDNLSSHWQCDIIPSQRFATCSSHNGIAELKIRLATRFYYFDAEIYDKDLPYKYNNMKIKVKVDPIMKGSRGWGFWNGNFGFAGCQMAWFIYQKGSPLYHMNGLWVQCVNGNPDNMTTRPIIGYDISNWHEYEIKWNENYTEFFIDKNLVANLSMGIPNTNCRADIWIDNAVWYWQISQIPYTPIFSWYKFIPNRILRPTSLYIDYIEITE